MLGQFFSDLDSKEILICLFILNRFIRAILLTVDAAD